MKIKQAALLSALLSIVLCLPVMGMNEEAAPGGADPYGKKALSKKKPMPLAEDAGVSNHTNGAEQEEEAKEILEEVEAGAEAGSESEDDVA